MGLFYLKLIIKTGSYLIKSARLWVDNIVIKCRFYLCTFTNQYPQKKLCYETIKLYQAYF